MRDEGRPESAIEPPVFILASPHSEVSLISAMLGRHPGAYAVPELNLFTVAKPVELFDLLPGARTHGLIRTVAQLYCGEQTLETAEAARRWIFRRLQLSTAEIHRELCGKVAPLRLIDPSELHTGPQRRNALERIIDTYPDAYFLHLVRHPRTQGEAWLRSPLALGQLFAIGAVDSSARNRIPDPQIDWYRRQSGILQFLSDIPADRKLRMRTEDILSDPTQHLCQLTKWLELDWSDATLAAMLQPENGSYSRPGPYGAEGGSDASFLTSPRFYPELREPKTLKGPLPWRPDGKGFLPELVALASSFGYA